MFENYSLELKQKIVSAVNNGFLVDVFGNVYTDINIDSEAYGSMLVKFMHHLMLNGVSDKKLTESLKLSGKSDIEIEYILNRSRTFISEVLGKDLNVFNNDVSKEMLPTLESKLAECNSKYKEYINSDITYNGVKFQADADSLAIMQKCISTNEEPIFWIDTDNNSIEFSLSNLNELHVSILQRKRDAFKKLTDFKTSIKTAYNKKDWSILIDFEIKF